MLPHKMTPSLYFFPPTQDDECMCFFPAFGLLRSCSASSQLLFNSNIHLVFITTPVTATSDVFVSQASSSNHCVKMIKK